MMDERISNEEKYPHVIIFLLFIGVAYSYF
jgi:hypothetical protein